MAPLLFRLLPAGLLLLLLSSALRAQSGEFDNYSVYPLVTLNTSVIDFSPTFSPDGQRLYFVSARSGGQGGHDVWYAERTGDTSFGPPQNMGSTINSSSSEGGLAIAGDGTTVFFTLCDRSDGRGDCDIYQGRLDGSEVRDIMNLLAINTDAWDAQPTVSADGKTLYFSSNRPGATGGSGDVDIYRSVLAASGEWSAPVRLDPSVNSAGREAFPFIAADSTLFFSSMRPGGYGSYDYYTSRWNGAEWSEAENMGVRFNTAGDERSICRSPVDGAICLARLGVGSGDLFLALRPSSGVEPRQRELPAVPSLTIAPNPAVAGSATICVEGGEREEREVTVSDRAGRTVLRDRMEGECYQLREGALAPGVYRVGVGTAVGELIVVR